MDSDAAVVATDRRLKETEFPAGPPGAENDLFEPLKKQTPPTSKETKPKRRNSRSKSPSHRRRRSRSNSSPDRRRRRFEDRDPRTSRGNRRSRSRDRPRSPPSRSRGSRGRNRSGSRDRFRGRRSRSNGRRNWSPNKKGPVSPPPIQQQQIQQAPPNFNMGGMQMYSDNYNNYQQPIGYSQPYAYNDYSLQPAAPPTFNAYVPPPVMQPVPPGDDFQSTNWNVPQAVMPPIQVQPPPIPVQPVESEEEKKKRIAAVDKEKKNQRATLRKQREDYKRRSSALKRELNILKEQRDDLLSGQEPPSPTTKGFLKENDRLQLQIENKISTIENVIDMLTGIIGTEKSPSPAPLSPVPANKSKPRSPSAKSDNDSTPERLKTKVIESLKKNKTESKGGRESVQDIKRSADDKSATKLERSEDPAKRINYVHYDPEMHWCKLCQVFPKTAKDYLTHLHSKEHLDNQKTVESPWHEKPINDDMPSYPDGQTKRTPIRGLQFFVPTTGWYCKMCSIWMGDLHCASLHLKSQTHALQYHDYTNQNPHFEIDWMSDRQKSYENKRVSAVVQAPSIPTVTETGIMMDSIPLQIQVAPKKPVVAINAADADSDEKKKKKKKKEDRKDKKKKKRSKKRKHSSSSSSSSGSSGSETDAATDKHKDDSSHSIRVAMRNLLKQQQNEQSKMTENASGKWTVVQPAQFNTPVPPPPTISANGAASDKKDELMISQWNAPEAIISEKEKKMLEELKGRLKNRSDDRESSSVVSKPDRDRGPSRERDRVSSRERDRVASRERDRVSSRERDRGSSRDRRRSRSRSRERMDRRSRRSRSRGGRRSKSRSRSPGRWSGRRRSRSRSHSRRIEKPIVRYPEFRPRVPEKDKKKSKGDHDATDTKHDKKSSVSTSKKTTSSTKKLPFIGRMPVFKKQTNEEEARRDDPVADTQMHTPIAQPVQAPIAYSYDNMHQMAHEDYDDLMPDPMQFVSLMGAPPPPPMVPPPQRADKNEPVLPPGIDEADADLVLKPISDAPLPRKGPLPQDFQDALSIIFPGEKRPDVPLAPGQTAGTETSAAAASSDQSGGSNSLQSENHQAAMMHDDHSQLSMDMFSAFSAANDIPSMINQQDMSFAEDVDVPVIVSQNLPLQQQVDAAIEKESDEAAEMKKLRMDELNDLAMLGIDADDLAAQCI